MSQTTKPAAKRLTTKQIILILGALIIICAAVVTAIFLLQDKPSGTPVVTEGNLKAIEGEIQDKVAKGMFMTHMNTTWVFPDGESPSSNAVMGNASGNNYPFWFTLTLSDTGDTLFTSGLIPVGSQIGEINLEKDLAQGNYPAVVTIHMVDDEGAEVESNMSFNITLTVEK